MLVPAGPAVLCCRHHTPMLAALFSRVLLATPTAVVFSKHVATVQQKRRSPRPHQPAACYCTNTPSGAAVCRSVCVCAGRIAGVHHFESHLGAFREHLEVEVSRLTAAAQQLTEEPGWWDNPGQVSRGRANIQETEHRMSVLMPHCMQVCLFRNLQDRVHLSGCDAVHCLMMCSFGLAGLHCQLLQVRFLNRMLDLCHWYLLSARVMLTQHSAALHALETQGSSRGSTGHSRGEPVVAGAATAEPQPQAEVMHYHEPGHKSTDPAQAYTPPHQQLVDARPMSLIQRQTPVMQVLQNVVEDCRYVGGARWPAWLMRCVGGSGIHSVYSGQACLWVSAVRGLHRRLRETDRAAWWGAPPVVKYLCTSQVRTHYCRLVLCCAAWQGLLCGEEQRCS